MLGDTFSYCIGGGVCSLRFSEMVKIFTKYIWSTCSEGLSKSDQGPWDCSRPADATGIQIGPHFCMRPRILKYFQTRQSVYQTCAFLRSIRRFSAAGNLARFAPFRENPVFGENKREPNPCEKSARNAANPAGLIVREKGAFSSRKNRALPTIYLVTHFRNWIFFFLP